ncbi:MAG: hypothetical protein DMG70_07890 [Acidobacteria bacterium]|nr:MAG: hypothetical protein DMG70_07890 [Acidobacteriota bacterium]
MLIEQEIAARRERAQGAVARILARPDADVYGDYQVRSSSNKTYRVALRGPGLFENYCSCPDFAVNTLGTCKHIEALLLRLGRRHGKAFEQGKFSRARASLSLHYGETLGVRLRLPSSPSPALQALAREYFDESGLLKSERLRDFEKLMDELYGLRQITGSVTACPGRKAGEQISRIQEIFHLGCRPKSATFSGDNASRVRQGDVALD